MTVIFRDAARLDVAAAVDLLRDDGMGRIRETAPPETYLSAFDEMQAEVHNRLVVGLLDGRVVATYQIAVVPGVSLAGARRAQIEGVRVAADLRGRGIGAALVRDAEARARAAGARLLQLTMNSERGAARRFYLAQGFAASHTGFKKAL